MPLIKSGSREAVSANIREMMSSGYPQKQAVAAALSNARRYRAEGGPVSEDRMAAGWLPKDDRPLDRYPTHEDVEFARQYGHFDIDPRSEYLNNRRYRLLTGNPEPWLNAPDTKELPAREFLPETLQAARPVMHNYYARGALASKRSALAALGFDPTAVAADITRDPANGNILGSMGLKDKNIYANARNPETLVHESIHRGIQRLKDTPNWQPEFDSYDALGANPSSHKNNELATRYLMARRIGAVERNAQLREQGLYYFNERPSQRKILEDMEMAASRYMASRNPRGPRAMGGRVYADGGDIPVDEPAAAEDARAIAAHRLRMPFFGQGDLPSRKSMAPPQPSNYEHLVDELTESRRQSLGEPPTSWSTFPRDALSGLGFAAAGRGPVATMMRNQTGKLGDAYLAARGDRAHMGLPDGSVLRRYDLANGERWSRNGRWIRHPDRALPPYRASGGPVGFTSGGTGSIMPWTERAAGRSLQHAGFIKSPVPGRTDQLPIGVGGGAYVLPADHVAHVGQGNSIAGGDILNKMFKLGTYGMNRGVKPRMPRLGMRRKQFAEGGAPGGDVDIVAAGGEYVIPPEVVAELGGGDMDSGHKLLDQWVLKTRRHHINTLRTLKPPKKS